MLCGRGGWALEFGWTCTVCGADPSAAATRGCVHQRRQSCRLAADQRCIDGEIALRLGTSVTPAQAAALKHDGVDGLIEAMAVSIEGVDSRWLEAGRAPALLRLADQQSHGALVLGDWLPYARRDWATQDCTVRIGSQPVVQRTGSHGLSDPAWESGWQKASKLNVRKPVQRGAAEKPIVAAMVARSLNNRVVRAARRADH